MTTAAAVPEASAHDDGAVWTTLAATGHRRLLADALMRMRVADGFSHARSLAFLVALVALQGLVAVIGVASAIGEDRIGLAALQITRTVAPGPVGDALLTAITQARANGGDERYVAIAVGVMGAAVTGTTAMGQVERSFNRLYGLSQDRPLPQKYGRAFLLAITAGVTLTGACGAIAFGSAVAVSIGRSPLTELWMAIRTPVALAAQAAAVAVLLRVCPARRQPSWRWLAPGGAVAAAMWGAVTVLLAFALRVSPSFGDAYGPLAGIVALLLWAGMSSMALVYGAAIAAQLEAARAGVGAPRADHARTRPNGDQTCETSW